MEESNGVLSIKKIAVRFLAGRIILSSLIRMILPKYMNGFLSLYLTIKEIVPNTFIKRRIIGDLMNPYCTTSDLPLPLDREG
jgi:hypothetical protein